MIYEVYEDHNQKNISDKLINRYNLLHLNAGTSKNQSTWIIIIIKQQKSRHYKTNMFFVF